MISLRGLDLNLDSQLEVYSYGPGSVAIRIVFTPWPIVLGLAVLSMAMAVYEYLRLKGQKKSHPVLWVCMWIFNMVRSVGILIWQVVDIRNKGGTSVPSIGIAVVFANLVMASTPHAAAAAYYWLPGYFGYITAVVGFVFYTVNGALVLAHHGFFDYSSRTVVVTKGCPDGPYLDYSANFACQNPRGYEFTDTTNVRSFLQAISWLVGLFPILWALFIVFQSRSSRFHRRIEITASLSIILIFPSLAALIDASLDTIGWEPHYYDCSNAQQRSDGSWSGCNFVQVLMTGSSTGFLSLWSQHVGSIVRSIFTW